VRGGNVARGDEAEGDREGDVVEVSTVHLRRTRMGAARVRHLSDRVRELHRGSCAPAGHAFHAAHPQTEGAATRIQVTVVRWGDVGCACWRLGVGVFAKVS
jgi:hypothetical protein